MGNTFTNIKILNTTNIEVCLVMGNTNTTILDTSIREGIMQYGMSGLNPLMIDTKDHTD